MLVIAHRGNNKEELENTFFAFEKAVSCGADRIELDLQMSADGKIFICHDDNLNRIVNRNILISQTSSKDIQNLQLSDNSRIPTLEEVLEKFLPRIEINCELKGDSIDLACKAAQMVSSHPLHSKVIFSCFEYAPISYLRDEFPLLKRACLTGDFSIKWPDFSLSQPVIFMLETATKIWHPLAQTLNENSMDFARKHGWQVYPWIPMVGEDNNREQLWTILLSLGIDGLCTNYPRELINWLAKNKTIDLQGVAL